MEHFNMEEFAGGAFTEQVNRELRRVVENIQDPNTEAKAKRRINVAIEFVPNEARNFGTIGVQANSKLAPALGAVTAISMGKNIKTGEVDAVEIGSQIPGQMNIKDVEEKEEPAEEVVQTVDPSTGEIYETTTSNVIDLRRARQA